MKKINFLKGSLMILTVTLLLSNCRKEVPYTPEEPSRSWGTASVLKNGVPLELSCATRFSHQYFNKFGLVLAHFNTFGELRGSFHFSNIPFKKGSYVPISYQYANDPATDSLLSISYNTLLSDGDVAGDRYQLKEVGAAGITIDSIRYATGEIWGRFHAEMVKDTSFIGEQDRNAPFELSVKDGTFHTRVIK